MLAGLTRASRLLASRFRRLASGLVGGFDPTDRAAVDSVLARHGLPPLDDTPPAVATRDGCLATGEKLFDLRDDVRAAIPLALTPAGREAYLSWFLSAGDVGATFPDLLRVLLEQDARPDRGLAATYLVTPGWQAACPDALTPAGWAPFKAWVARECGVTGRWLQRATLPPRFAGPPPAGPGVNVLGLFRHPSGLQQNAVAVVDALKAVGVTSVLRDIPVRSSRDHRPRAGFDGLEVYPVTLLDTGLDLSAAEAYRLAGLYPRPGVHRVAVWSWELEQLPAGWLDRGDGIDEVWAPTRFIADAVRPLRRPVYTILTPVPLGTFTPRPKTHFGLSADKFTFLFVFDMNSRLARKNPIGLIRAFRRAFRPDEPVELAIKVSPQEGHHAACWRELRAAVAEAGVRLIDRALPRKEVLALMNAADAYASLHRSEGVGFTMAEAMQLGKPTVGTAYSGNLDFMTPENSYLVDYELVTLQDDAPPYPKGCVWAEPSVEHAAVLLRRIYDRPDEARAVAARGQSDARRLFDPAAAGRRMADRLAAIARERGQS